MGYSFWDKVKMWMCKTFGHKPSKKPEDTWEFKGINHVCTRCSILYKEGE